MLCLRKLIKYNVDRTITRPHGCAKKLSDSFFIINYVLVGYENYNDRYVIIYREFLKVIYSIKNDISVYDLKERIKNAHIRIVNNIITYNYFIDYARRCYYDYVNGIFHKLSIDFYKIIDDSNRSYNTIYYKYMEKTHSYELNNITINKYLIDISAKETIELKYKNNRINTIIYTKHDGIKRYRFDKLKYRPNYINRVVYVIKHAVNYIVSNFIKLIKK